MLFMLLFMIIMFGDFVIDYVIWFLVFGLKVMVFFMLKVNGNVLLVFMVMLVWNWLVMFLLLIWVMIKVFELVGLVIFIGVVIM